MKKKFMVLVAFLVAALVIPKGVLAAEGSVEIIFRKDDSRCKCETKEENGFKYTKCNVIAENKGTVKSTGMKVTLTFKPAVDSTTLSEFNVNTSSANLDKTTEQPLVKTLDINPINPGEYVILATATWKADAKLSEKDCGGSVSPKVETASDSSGTSSDTSGGVTETGYAVPYIALGVGAVGIITVAATSKKKNKMYKI